MARVACGGRGSSALTSLRGPMLAPPATAGGIRLREVGVFNTTSTALAVALGITSDDGTPTGTPTEVNVDDPTHTINGVVTTHHSGDATITGAVRQASLGGAVGAGIVWTFGENGLFLPESGTTVCAIIYCPTGTGQIVDFYFEWDD